MLGGMAWSFLSVALLSQALGAAAPPAPYASVESKAVRHALGKSGNLAEMLGEIDALRSELSSAASGGGWDAKLEVMEKQLEDLEDMLRALDAQEKAKSHEKVVVSHADLQSEIDRLREAVRRIEGVESGSDMNNGSNPDDDEKKKLVYNIPVKKDADAGPSDDASTNASGDQQGEASGDVIARSANSARSSDASVGSGSGGEHVESRSEDDVAEDVSAEGASNSKGESDGGHFHDAPTVAGEGHKAGGGDLDVDTQMPYGDLEPFGREDTAQELTESSIRESDQMVDQLERAEVAEEKRAVFRALTRLRGAAITSYDGIARSQTGNIDDYARTNQWRKVHPVHHLAAEEGDVSRWAFPNSADF